MMTKRKALIISSIILISSCGKPTYTKEDCIRKTKNFIDSSFDSAVFIKDDKIVATNILYLKMNDKDSIYKYKTESVWPISLTYFHEKGDILEKKKGDSILYIIKKDTILRFQYACDQSYINGRPVQKILKEKGLIRE